MTVSSSTLLNFQKLIYLKNKFKIEVTTKVEEFREEKT